MTREADGTAFQEGRYAQIEAAEEMQRSIEGDGQTLRPKIQRVAHYLREREKFAKYYSPKLVSFGPIHHGGKNLKLGEQYKLIWTGMYVGSSKQRAIYLHQQIAENIEGLRKLYAEDIAENYSDKDLAWMLFVDGCSLLQIMEKNDLMHPELLKVKVDQLVLVLMDVLLLENQVPLQVLKLLSNNDEKKVREVMKKFLVCHHFQVPKREEQDKDNRGDRDQNSTRGDHDLAEIRIQVDQPIDQQLERLDPNSPTHLLDCLRTIVFGHCHLKKADNNKPKRVETQPGGEGGSEKQERQPAPSNPVPLNGDSHTDHTTPSPRTKEKDHLEFPTYRNIQELKKAGIGVKRDQNASQTDITFKSSGFAGTIYLSKLIVDETIAPGFLNLIAYEMCPDYENNFAVSSYVAFLDSLIDHPDDVKDLRSAGVLHNALGSDEEVAELFNTIATDVVPDMAKYAEVRAQIDEHYKKIHMRWLNQVCSTHFSTPWTIIAFLAALLALGLSVIQTVFTLPPFSNS